MRLFKKNNKNPLALFLRDSLFVPAVFCVGVPLYLLPRAAVVSAATYLERTCLFSKIILF
jgi:hypothetical protein